jgi:hypothetical protein
MSRPFEDDEDGIAVLCYKPAHLSAFPVAGSVKRDCDECGLQVWVSPSSVDALGVALGKGHTAVVVCCCCGGLHDMKSLMDKSPLTGRPLHWHDFKDGDCECGMPRANWTKEIEDNL